jgi:hypothetical protein
LTDFLGNRRHAPPRRFDLARRSAYDRGWLLTFMRGKRERSTGRTRRVASIVAIFVSLGALCPAAVRAAQAKSDRRAQDRLDDARRREGEALVDLVDAAMRGRPGEPDFAIAWRNDFFKAQPGTFVPFTVTIDPDKLSCSTALLYVRAARRDSRVAGRDVLAPYPFDAVFPVDVPPTRGKPLRISRGFAVPAGDYDVYVAVRERAASPLAAGQPHLKSAVLKQPITVPDFWTTDLAASTVMLADRIDDLPAPLAADSLFERPYVIGQREIQPAADTAFRKDRELIVVFLIYNPSVTAERQFDVQVDYHFYRRGAGSGAAAETPAAADEHARPRAGERYVTRTRPQRFNPSTVGGGFDPRTGNPVLAGQGILLSSFQEGEYRLGITVTDLLSRKSLTRDVAFTVVGS